MYCSSNTVNALRLINPNGQAQQQECVDNVLWVCQSVCSIHMDSSSHCFVSVSNQTQISVRLWCRLN